MKSTTRPLMSFLEMATNLQLTTRRTLALVEK